MNDTAKQKLMIAGVGVLVLGAGTYFVFGGKGTETPQPVVVQVDPADHQPTPAPSDHDRIRRPPSGEKEPVVRRIRTPGDGDEPHRSSPRKPGRPKDTIKRKLPPAG